MRSPAFQFYPKDFLADANVAAMTNEETGIYIRLLCYCWLEGSIPNDAMELARMVREKARVFEAAWPAIQRCFILDDDGRLVQPRLEEERHKQAVRKAKQSAGGTETAKKLWGKHKPTYSLPISDHIGKQRSSSAFASPTTLPSVGESRARRSDAWEFGIWFFEQGKDHGLVAEHVSPVDAGSTEVELSEKLLATYGREKCEEVALRFIGSTAQRKSQGSGVKRFAIATLAEMWTLFESSQPRSAKSAQDAAIEEAMSSW